MEELPNGWTWEAARKEAVLRLDREHTACDGGAFGAWSLASVNVAARLIATHEEPPVDPDLMLAREIAALVCGALLEAQHAKSYRDGCYDEGTAIPLIVKLLKERKG